MNTAIKPIRSFFINYFTLLTQNQILLSGTFANICIFIYYSHVLNFIFRPFFTNPSKYIQAFYFPFFFSDVSNIIQFIHSQNFSLVVFGMAALATWVPFIVLIFCLISFEKRWAALLGKALAGYLMLYNWIIFIPINNILISPFEKSQELTIFPDSFLLNVIGLVTVAVNIFLAVISLFSMVSLEFLDNVTLRLNFSTAKTTIVFVLRLTLSVASPLLQDMSIIFYIMLQLLFALIFIGAGDNFPLRNNDNCRFFLGMLMMSESIMVCIFSMEVLQIFDENEFFFVAALISFLSFKLGQKLFDRKYQNLMLLAASKPSTSFFLEEIHDIALKSKSMYKKSHFLLLGVSYSHLHRGKKKFISVEKNEENTVSLTNSIIIENFKRLLHFSLKDPLERQSLIIKFISFMLKSNLNPITGYFELQKCSVSRKISFFLDIHREILQKSLEKKIKDQKYNKINKLSVETFFKVARKISDLDKKLHELLKIKKNFWEKYLVGITGNTVLIDLASNFSKKVIMFQNEFLKPEFTNSSSLSLVRMKYLSIIHSNILNSFNKALLYEEEFDSLLRRNIDTGCQDILNSLSFLDKNMAITMISCLNGDCRLRERNERLARLFGYTLFEMQAVQSVNTLMPNFIAKVHDRLIKSMLFRSKSLHEHGSRRIESFGLSKRGFLFPLEIFYGFYFEDQEDFTLVGSIKRFDEGDYSDLVILIDSYGEIIGFTEKIYDFLHEIDAFLKTDDLYTLNIWWVLSCFDQFGLENDCNNLTSELRIPVNLKELLDKMKARKLSHNNEDSSKKFFLENSKAVRTLGIVFDHRCQKFIASEEDPSLPSYSCLILKRIKPINQITNMTYSSYNRLATIEDDPIQRESLEKSSFLSKADIKNFKSPDSENDKASSLGESRRNPPIFSVIEAIQQHYPYSIKCLSLLMLVEILMIVIFFSISYSFYKDYVNIYYDPTQKSLINYCSLATSLSYSTAMFTEVEYASFQLINRTLSPMKRIIWSKIMNENYELMKNINFKERNIEGQLPYQKIYQTVQNPYVDPLTWRILKVRYTDNLDLWGKIIFETIDNFNATLTKEQQILLQRNYPYMLPSTSVIYLAVKSDFNNSNIGTTQTIFNLLISFLAINALLKIFEAFFLIKFHKMLTKILMIFRRVGQKDAVSELRMLQEMIDKVGKEGYLSMRFSDKIFSKTTETNPTASQFSQITEGNLLDNKRQRSQGKKAQKASSFYNLQQLPKKGIVLFTAGVIVASFVYYFFNYYFWINNNVSINNLIQINTFFIDVYIYSTSIIGFNTMAIRERVTRNPEFEAINETYQKHSTRLSYFFASLSKRIAIIGTTADLFLPRYTLEAQKNMKSPEFDMLVLSDNCRVLRSQGKISSDEELAFCQSSFKGAFNNGILSLVTHYILMIKDYNSYTMVYPANETQKIEQQAQACRNFINTPEYEDFMFSYYYYHNILLIYYNMINDYYKGLMDQQMTRLYIFLVLTSIVAGFVFLGLSFGLRKRLHSYYSVCAWCLSIIPYEKLCTDDQTKFLINNFRKKL